MYYNYILCSHHTMDFILPPGLHESDITDVANQQYLQHRNFVIKEININK